MDETAKNIVVVGAGFVGLATTHQLLQDGHNVVCLEASSSFGQGASHSNGALLCPSMTRPWGNPDVVKMGFKCLFDSFLDAVLPYSRSNENSLYIAPTALLQPAFWGWSVRFLLESLLPTRLSQNYIQSYRLSQYSVHTVMADETWPQGPSYGRNSKGTLQLFPDAESAESCRSACQEAINEGCHLEVYNADKTEALLGNYFDYFKQGAAPASTARRAGLWSTNDANGDIRKASQSLLQSCQQMGGTIRFGTKVERLVPAHDSPRAMAGVELENGDIIEADHIVIATGNDAQQLADETGDLLNIYPVQGFVITVPIKSPGMELDINICDDQRKLYLAPIQDASDFGFKHGAVRLSGCALFDTFSGFHYPMTDLDNGIVKVLLDSATGSLPDDYVDVDRAVIRKCWRPQTPNDLPVIGPSVNFDNVWFNCGHGHLGWTRGAGSARILADLIGDVDHHTQFGLSAETFRPQTRFESLLGRE